MTWIITLQRAVCSADVSANTSQRDNLTLLTSDNILQCSWMIYSQSRTFSTPTRLFTKYTTHHRNILIFETSNSTAPGAVKLNATKQKYCVAKMESGRVSISNCLIEGFCWFTGY